MQPPARRAHGGEAVDAAVTVNSGPPLRIRLHTCLALHPGYDVFVLPDDEVVFSSPPAYTTVGSPLAAELVRALARPRRAVEAAREAASRCSATTPEALVILHNLIRAGLAIESQEDEVPLGLNGATGTAITCVGFTPADAARLAGALGPLRPSGVHLVLARDYLDPAVEHAVREASGPTLLVRPVGTERWAGPLFLNGDPAAYDRLADRVRRNLPMEPLLDHLRAELVRRSVADTDGAGFATFADGIRRADRLIGRLLAFPRDGSPPVAHPVAGSVRRRRAAPTVPLPDGGYRTVSPEATWRRLRTHLSPITGAASGVRRCRTADQRLYLFASAYTIDHFPSNLVAMNNRVQWSAGKGVRSAQARVSAICEALERHCGTFRGDELWRTWSYEDIPEAIHPDALQKFSRQQFEARHANSDLPGREDVPAPFDPTAKMRWSPVRSILHGRTRWVPTAWAYYSVPDPVGVRFCTAESNGCAAGNTYEEALLQGLLELVERDAVAVWWYNRIRRPGVDLEALQHPLARSVRRAANQLGRDVWALDLTHDLGLPVFAVISRRRTPPEQIVFGFGCHPDPAVALLRALSELVQALPFDDGLPAGPADIPRPPAWGPAADVWLAEGTVAAHSYLTPDPNASYAVVPDAPASAPNNLADVLADVLDIVRSAAEDVLVLDQSRPDVPLTVVRVVAPGLRHFWRRLAPGRLYSVPVTMGWRSSPLLEGELNSTTLFT